MDIVAPNKFVAAIRNCPCVLKTNEETFMETVFICSKN